MYYMSTPVAVRFDETLLSEVRRIAKRRTTSVSSVIQTFTEEGVRTQQVPGIQFRDGPAGRRAGVAGSLDVWEIIDAARQLGSTDPAIVASALDLPVRVVLIAFDYYSRFPEEIDEWIADNEKEADRAHGAWLRKRALA